MTKNCEEIMEILEAYDLTRCPSSAAELAGSNRKTAQRYVGLRDAAASPHCASVRVFDEDDTSRKGVALDFLTDPRVREVVASHPLAAQDAANALHQGMAAMGGRATSSWPSVSAALQS